MSLKNRLQSILFDSQFVEETQHLIGLPLVANERCGQWYVSPSIREASCYFKSTDGHRNEWSFSLRRLNLHLLPIIAQNGGIIIVDSTKGKKMSDALLKTIPIWCAVLNYILFENEYYDVSDQFNYTNVGEALQYFAKLQKELSWLIVPEEVVSEQERVLIVKRIADLVTRVKDIGLINKQKLKEYHITKPLVPQWIVQGKTNKDKKFLSVDNCMPSTSVCHRIFCVNASRNTEDDNSSEIIFTNENLKKNKSTSWNYVQGAGDDHEMWTKDLIDFRLHPDFFWRNLIMPDNKIFMDLRDPETRLLYDWVSEDILKGTIKTCYINRPQKNVTERSRSVDVTCLRNGESEIGIYFGAIVDNLKYHELVNICGRGRVNQVIILSTNYKVVGMPDKSLIRIKQENIESSKKGSRLLRNLLPLVEKEFLDTGNVMVLCDTGKDLSVGIVLALLCKHFDTSWKKLPSAPKISKDLIRKHLGNLSEITSVNPSRNTLQSVNSFLM